MKSFRCLLALALCLAVAGIAKADPLDYKMGALDAPPTTLSVLESSSTFSFSFQPCSNFGSNLPPGLSTTIATSGDAADWGCFEGQNDSGADPDDIKNGIYTPDSDDKDGQTWTSLTLTFSNNGATLGQPAGCSSTSNDLLPDSIFSTTGGDCGATTTGDLTTLIFTGGDIANGSYFFIVEDDPGFTPNDLPAVTVDAPEPTSALLLATGIGFFGLALYKERRRMLCAPVRS